jgi:hypothetical protein
MYGELGERPLVDALEVDAATTVGEAVANADGRWVVITGREGAPISAAAPAALAAEPPDRTLAEVLPYLAATVVAAADTPVSGLVDSWVVGEIGPDSAFIVMAHGRVSGIWAGPGLQEMVRLHGLGWSDTGLPGDIEIPLLTRACGHVEQGANCTSVEQFAERPAVPPACANPAGLSPHAFVW